MTAFKAAGQPDVPETQDEALRLAFMDEAMRQTVLPTLCEGPGGTGSGIAAEWTFGRYAAGSRAMPVDTPHRSV